MPKSRIPMPNLPPAGVSAINESGGHVPIESAPGDSRAAEEPAPRVAAPLRAPQEAAPARKITIPRRGGRKMRPGDDVLAHPEQGREVHSQTPTGVQGKGRSVIEMKPPKFQKPSRHTASFTSVDGLEYSFRTHDTKGKAMPYLQTMVLYLALIEQAKGGSVSTVFQAFKVKIEDMDGNPYFPIPDEVIEELGLKKPFVIEEDVEEIDPGFSLGD